MTISVKENTLPEAVLLPDAGSKLHDNWAAAAKLALDKMAKERKIKVAGNDYPLALVNKWNHFFEFAFAKKDAEEFKPYNVKTAIENVASKFANGEKYPEEQNTVFQQLLKQIRRKIPEQEIKQSVKDPELRPYIEVSKMVFAEIALKARETFLLKFYKFNDQDPIRDKEIKCYDGMVLSENLRTENFKEIITYYYRSIENASKDIERKKGNKLTDYYPQAGDEHNLAHSIDTGTSKKSSEQNLNLFMNKKGDLVSFVRLVSSEIDKMPESIKNYAKERFFNEQKYEEIADKFKVPVGTVKTGVFRAKKILLGNPQIKKFISENNFPTSSVKVDTVSAVAQEKQKELGL